MHSPRPGAHLKHNFPLKDLNSFKISVKTSLFSAPRDLEQMVHLTKDYDFEKLPFMVLGEGSNLLFTGDYQGLILKPDFHGIRQLSEDKQSVMVEIGAGENWDSWVQYALRKGWYGLENLSLIPGSVGASPVQNIGAYGVELKDRFSSLEAWDLKENKVVQLSAEECGFGYRDSIFKSKYPNRYVIIRVVFRLKKTPELQLGYGPVREEFQRVGGSGPGDLRSVIISIRKGKLPDPADYGNAGSFFKNPVIPVQLKEDLQKSFGEMPGYPVEKTDRIKVPAAWLIEKAGWKGRRKGNVGSWPGQPLVIVNYGSATGQEILDFSENIRHDIHLKFGILLEREVKVVRS